MISSRMLGRVGAFPHRLWHGSKQSLYKQSTLSRASMGSQQSWRAWATAGTVTLAFFIYSSDRIMADAKEAIPLFQEPTTGRLIPTSIELEYPDRGEETASPKTFDLIGSGARQVTLLNISVYVASFYMNQDLAASLKASPLWKKFTSIAFEGSEGVWYARDLTRKHKGAMLMSILPVRNTNGAHLKTGFLKSLKAAFKKEKGFLTAEEIEAAEKAITSFDTLFPSGAITTATRLAFIKTRFNELVCQLNDDVVFKIHSQWLSQHFFEAYLTPDNPISPGLRSSIAQGLEKIVQQ